MKWHIDPTQLSTHNKLVCRKTAQYAEYFLNGLYHNPNGPARIWWYPNGNIDCEFYYINGLKHRDDGPAHRSWWEDGELWAKSYWQNGRRVMGGYNV